MLRKTDKYKNNIKIKKQKGQKMSNDLSFLKLPTQDKRILAIDELLGE
jgi:hypothetical protein